MVVQIPPASHWDVFRITHHDHVAAVIHNPPSQGQKTRVHHWEMDPQEALQREWKQEVLKYSSGALQCQVKFWLLQCSAELFLFLYIPKKTSPLFWWEKNLYFLAKSIQNTTVPSCPLAFLQRCRGIFQPYSSPGYLSSNKEISLAPSKAIVILKHLYCLQSTLSTLCTAITSDCSLKIY